MNSRNNIPVKLADRRPANPGRVLVVAILAALVVLCVAATMFNGGVFGSLGAWYGDAPAQISDSAVVEQPAPAFGAGS